MHPVHTHLIARLHAEQLQREAAAHRRHRGARPGLRPARPPTRQRVGESLIRLGSRLADPAPVRVTQAPL